MCASWGLDIARSLADAGGVGALLQIRDYAGSGKDYLPGYDGNGNVVALFDADTANNGACVAAYEYSPFGELIRSDGTYATDNPFRFSTKFTDGETGLVYYGRRYYSPSQGRFLGRDPIQERGGLNLYAFVRNRPINTWDIMGMLGADVIWMDGGPGAYDNVTGQLDAWSRASIAARQRGTPFDPTYDGYRSRRKARYGDWDNGIDSTPPLGPDPFSLNAGAATGRGVISNYDKNQLVKMLTLVDPTKATHFVVSGIGDEKRAQESKTLTEALVDRLRDLRRADGTLTQAAMYLRTLEQSGYANLISIEGRMSSDTNSRADAETRYTDIAGATDRSKGTGSTILIDVNNFDSLAALGHELVHAFKGIVGVAAPGSFRFDEGESLAVENEVLFALGLKDKIKNDYKGLILPDWNKYIPMNAPVSGPGG